MSGIEDEQMKSIALELADEAGICFTIFLILLVKYLSQLDNCQYNAVPFFLYLIFAISAGLELKLITKRIVENIRSEVGFKNKDFNIFIIKPKV